MSDIAYCANGRCGADFLRLSDGTLFVCPSNNSHFAWLCKDCMKLFRIDWLSGTPTLVASRLRPLGPQLRAHIVSLGVMKHGN